MTRIFEALQQAALDQHTDGGVIDFPGSALEVESQSSIATPISAKIAQLYRSICEVLPQQPSRVIHVLGSGHESHSSGLLRGLAKTVCEHLNKAVLIIDASRASTQFAHFSLQPGPSLAEVLRSRRDIGRALSPVDDSGLYLASLTRDSQLIERFLDADNLNGCMESLRNRFELILLDSPSANESPESLALSRLADGAVVIVEAERTRRQVARNLSQNIENQGGRVIGVVLNKQKFHIPEFVYSRI